MMFPKPTPYNSLQNRSSKPKKEVAPWRQGILSHHQDRPSTKDRGEFPRSIIAELIAEADGQCQCCKTSPDTTTHHVMPRGRKGRGVKSNGMRLCWPCHDNIQTDEEQLQYWIAEWEIKFGPRFWFDAQDWEEYDRKQVAVKEKEQEQQQHTERLEPIVDLLSAATGRTLKAKEMRLLNGMNDQEMVVFAKLMQEVVGSQLASEKPFGYGHFDD